MPKVTVLMAVYNSEKFLKPAIDSILNQTFGDFEFLIINDGSTDESAKIILSYVDERITYVENEQNIGLTKSLNKGLRLAQGEYVARMDADDVSLPERLKKQVAYLDQHQKVALVGAHSALIDEQGQIYQQYKPYNWTSELLFYSLAFRNVMAHSSVMFRTQTIAAIGGYDENVRTAQDFELWQRVTRKYAAMILPDILIHWRNNEAGISNKKKEQQQKQAESIYINYMRKLQLSEQIILNASIFHQEFQLGWSEHKINCDQINALMQVQKRLFETRPGYVNAFCLKVIFWKKLVYYFLKKML